MGNTTKRRGFIKGALLGLAGLAPLLNGCIAGRVSESARDKSKGKPWRCSNCGHLTRSEDDLTEDRCPRCYSKKFVQVTEEEFAEYLKKEAAEK